MTAEHVLNEILRAQYPSREHASAEIGRLSAELELPAPAVHVISDVHGDDVKLRHVINNASGTLRPIVERRFQGRRSPEEMKQLLTLIFYPQETLTFFQWSRGDAQLKRALLDMFELIQELAKSKTFHRVREIFPKEYAGLFEELIFDRLTGRGERGFEAVLDTLVDRALFVRFVRVLVRAVRDLAIDELIVAGDLYDRGPRGDRVVDYLMRQPSVRFAWGNHDMAWIGAALGSEALIAHVLRVSTRYRRLSQLEEGYGITLQPLEKLARDVYGDDPAEHFKTKGKGLRDDQLMARMQKAVAVIQFKLEGQVLERNPGFGLEHRRLLHRMNTAEGTIEIDGVLRHLKDTRFPTIDRSRPYDLTPDEAAFLERTKRSFLSSDRLWRHIRFLSERGSMCIVLDDHAIFHGCIPVDAEGRFLPFEIDGKAVSGRALFEALDRVVARAVENPTTPDLDILWYLWCGPRSPLFGKDRITTFERDLVVEPESHTETKNPYFKLIHERAFCERVLTELGADPSRGLIVNGHVPVKIEKGEDPVKKSGKAITIDGAFSAAYGDHGFTLVIEPEGTYLAEHSHFESVAAAVESGIDIIPKITAIQRWERPRKISDTERGRTIRTRIEMLRNLWR
jgi:fructose-1,6-bisphosphatase III